MKRLYAVLLLALGLALSAHAATATVEEAEHLVRDTAQQVLDILAENRDKVQKDPAFLYGLVNEVILPKVDFTAMSKLVLAKHWRKATPEQRERFVQAFKGMLVRTYTRSLSEYAGNTEINYGKTISQRNGKYVTVKTEILRKGRKPIPVDYKLRRSRDGQYRIYDVVIEGLSLVKNYRTSFAKQISEQGLDALIADLERKNREQGGGVVAGAG